MGIATLCVGGSRAMVRFEMSDQVSPVLIREMVFLDTWNSSAIAPWDMFRSNRRSISLTELSVSVACDLANFASKVVSLYHAFYAGLVMPFQLVAAITRRLIVNVQPLAAPRMTFTAKDCCPGVKITVKAFPIQSVQGIDTAVCEA